MRDAPAAELSDLLEQLGLATRADLLRVRRLAHSLARDLPLFDSVWLDALVRHRMLTPYQAAQINAGQGEQLGVGPYVLLSPLDRLGYANLFLARERTSNKTVRLLLATVLAQAEQSLAEMKTVAEQLARAQQAETTRHVLPLLDSGLHDGRLWVAHPVCGELTARDWLLRQGRLTPPVVLEIARQMAASLAELERFGLVHTDLSASSLWFTTAGDIRLAQLGFRGAVRPREGYAQADLSPETYDYLAPERITAGTPADFSSDLYACGCLWWHLLTGRPPLAGGDALSKIKAVHGARISDVLRLAPETPPELAQSIAALTKSNPAQRPASFAAVAAQLGGSTLAGQAALAQAVSLALPRSKKLVQHQPQQPVTVPAALETQSFVPRKHSPLRKQLWHLRLASHFTARPKLSLVLAGSMLLVCLTAGLVRQALRSGQAETQKLVAQSGPAAAVNQSDGPALLDPQAPANARQLTPNTPRPGEITLLSAEQARELTANQVQSTGYEALLPTTNHNDLTTPELLLPADRIIAADSLELHSGLRLAPAPGKRARIQVPPGGWRIDVERIRCENIDFLPPEQAADETNDTILQLLASQAEFHGCTFQAGKNRDVRWKAFYWPAPDRPLAVDQLPPAGRLLLVDCVLNGLHTGIDCRRAGPLVLELDNVLFAGAEDAARSGPLWRLDRCPTTDETFVLRMNACTVRNAMALVDLYYPLLPPDPGRLQLESTDCVFAARATGALVRMIGPAKPERLLHCIAWEGQGSLLPLEGRFGLWYDQQGQPHVVDDAPVSIDGLVRGGFEFASGTPLKPADSALTHWAAPLRSDARPGIRAASLPSAAPGLRR